MPTLEQLISRFGLPTVFVGAALEGDATPVMAGVVAHLGLVRFGLAIVAGTLGTLAGDLAWYALGRWRGDWLRGTRLYRASVGRVTRLVDRVGAAELLMARLVYGTRNASMVYWGMRGLPLWRFLVIDAVGAALWVSLLSLLGYLASDRAEALLGQVKATERWLLGGVVVALVVVAIHWGVSRWRTQATEP